MKFIEKYTVLTSICIAVLISGCKSGSAPVTETAALAAPRISQDGATIQIAKNSTDQIVSEPARLQDVANDLKAPCKVVMAAVPASSGTTPAFLYENTDLSEIFADYTRTKSQLDRAKRNYERLKNLVSHEAAAAKDLIDLETEIAQLQTSIVATENKLRLSGLDLHRCLALQPRTVLCIADFPEAQLNKIKAGGTVNIVFNSFPNVTFTSRVNSMGSVVDPVTRTVKAEVIVGNQDGKLLPGLYGQIRLGVKQESGIAVPVNSVFTAKGKSFLFVEEIPGTFKLREVITGSQGSDWVEILQGVAAGERVVVKGTMLLKALSFGY